MTPSTGSDRYPSRPYVETEARLRWGRYDWAVLILLALLTALFFWRILTPNLADRASFPPGDFSYQFWAFSTFEARELSAGRLPLWNPYTYAGAPFWADIQSAVLYPLSLLTLLLSGPWGFSLFALEVEAVAHFWLAGTFTYMFVRRLTKHRSGALFAGIVYTFAGYLTGYPSQQLAVLETVVWLPLLLFFTDRALVDRSGEAPYLRPGPADTLAAGLVWGLAILAGHPQSAMFLFYTFVLYALFLILSYRKRPASYSLLYLLTPLWILLIGFGLSAIAWLPGLEYMRLSVRAGGLYDEMSGGFPLYDPIQMLLPGSVSFYSPLYVGILPLLLGIWAAVAWRRRETIFWGVLAAIAFLLSFGGETFLYSPFYLAVPGFSIFRGQERAALVVSFALAVLAGYGFKYQIARQQAGEPEDSGLRRVVGWLLIGAIGLDILFFYALNNAGWQDDSPFNALLSQGIWLTIVLSLVWAAMQIVRHWGQLSRRAPSRDEETRWLLAPDTFLAISYLLIVTLDLFTVNWKTNVYPSLPEAQTAVPALVQAIRQDSATNPDELFRVYNEYRIYENYGVPFELEDAWGASPLRLARYDEMYRTLRMERIWQLLNVKYVITWRQELYAPSEIIYQEPADDDVTYVHRLVQVAPRAGLVYQAQGTEEDEALARLDAFDFDPARMALVPAGTSLSLEAPPGDEMGQVEVVGRTPSSLVLDVTTPTDGLLVLSEVYYPGWRAEVDGQPTGIVRVDYLLRGIPVPSGGHRVEVRYRPVTLITGAVISGITLILGIAGGLWVWMRRRRASLDEPGKTAQ